MTFSNYCSLNYNLTPAYLWFNSLPYLMVFCSSLFLPPKCRKTLALPQKANTKKKGKIKNKNTHYQWTWKRWQNTSRWCTEVNINVYNRVLPQPKLLYHWPCHCPLLSCPVLPPTLAEVIGDKLHLNRAIPSSTAIWAFLLWLKIASHFHSYPKPWEKILQYIQKFNEAWTLTSYTE